MQLINFRSNLVNHWIIVATVFFVFFVCVCVANYFVHLKKEINLAKDGNFWLFSCRTNQCGKSQYFWAVLRGFVGRITTELLYFGKKLFGEKKEDLELLWFDRQVTVFWQASYCVLPYQSRIKEVEMKNPGSHFSYAPAPFFSELENAKFQNRPKFSYCVLPYHGIIGIRTRARTHTHTHTYARA